MAYYKCTGFDTGRVTAGAGDILAGKTVVGRAGELINGVIPSAGGVTGYVSGETQRLASAGTYLTGDVMLSPLSVSNLTPENIKEGVRIMVNNGIGNICDVTGTFSSSATLRAVQFGGGGGGWVSIPANILLVCMAQTYLDSAVNSQIINLFREYRYGTVNNANIGSEEVYDRYGDQVQRVWDYYYLHSPVPSFQVPYYPYGGYIQTEVANACYVLFDDFSADMDFNNLVTWLWIGRTKQDLHAAFKRGSLNVMFNP